MSRAGQYSTRAGNPVSNNTICGTNVELGNIQDCITVDAPYSGGSYQPADQKVYNPLAPQSTFYFITPLEATIHNLLIQNLWSLSLAVVDILLVLVLMLNGLKVMIGGSIFRYADAVEGLPNILIALIAAHASFSFIGFFLGLNNTLSGDLYNWVNTSPVMQNITQQEATKTINFTDAVHLGHAPTSINDPELPQRPSDPSSQGETCAITKAGPAFRQERGANVPIPGTYDIDWSCTLWTVTTNNDATNFTQGVTLNPPPTGIDDPRLPQHPPANAQSQGRTCARTGIRTLRVGSVILQGYYNLQWTCIAMVLTPTDLNFTNIDLGSVILNEGNIIPVLAQILGVIVIAQVVIRLFFLNLYIALAPICLSCWALPGKAGQPVTRLWLTGFLATVMVQFLQVIALIVISIGGQLFLATYSQSLAGVIGPDLLGHILQLIMLGFILQIPELLNAAPMRTLVEAGHAATQAVSISVSAQVMVVQAGIQEGTVVIQNASGAIGTFIGMF